MTHEVKILERYASAHFRGEKPWELRLNDRNYKCNDFINFTIITDTTKVPRGMTYVRKITSVFKGYGLEKGYCILTLER